MKDKECLFPKCDKTPLARGLCVSHYNSARLLVRKNITTWAKLESSGKALPKAKNHATEATKWFLSK